MKQINKVLIVMLTSLVVSLNNLNAYSETHLDQLPKLNTYNVNLNSLEDFYSLKRGSTLNLILLDNISTNKNYNNINVEFQLPISDNLNIKATGIVSSQSEGSRLSKSSHIQFSINKLLLNDGQEIYFSANSPLFVGTNPPHANPNGIALSRFITNLSLVSSPLTFGSSLGISFLANGLLSARQNGISDFFWGGFYGIGFPLFENVFRKQPEINLTSGTSIPFTLKRDLKISKGIHKENIEYLSLSKEEALNKIQELIKRGDLTGALELAIKTNQKEIYDKLMKDISS